MPLLLSFKWPSIPYALDILAWDVFFALAVLFAAPVFTGNRLATWIRGLLVATGALSLAGLSGSSWATCDCVTSEWSATSAASPSQPCC